MSDEVIGTVSASMGRRVLGIVSLAFLGVMLIYVCFTQPPAALGQFILLLTGFGALWMADKMRRATSTAPANDQSRSARIKASLALST